MEQQYVPYREGEIKHLDCFHRHFPVGDCPFLIDRPNGLYRTILRQEGYWQVTFRDRIRQIAVSDCDYRKYCLERSALKLDQTPEVFYRAVDQAREASRIPAERISRAINELLGDAEDMPRKSDALNLLLFPVYIFLRREGYVTADLCR
ncbi:MAG: hypothetical protein KA054_01315 [Candidatus Moranbacteria bacterium]|nr:hypothetical protein [Candidatus Moranbacteria bacterium]